MKIDESLLMSSLLAKVPYNLDKQYRVFLTDREELGQKDLQIISLSDDLQTLAAASLKVISKP